MNVIGLAGLLIDGATALISDGRLIAAMEEERYARVKHASMVHAGGLPFQSLEACLRLGKLRPRDVDHVGYFFQPLREFFNLTGFRLRRSLLSPSTIAYYETYYLDSLRRHLAVERLMRSYCGGDIGFHWLSHHLTHAAGAYYPSPFDRAAILVVDALSEIECTSLYLAEGNRIQRLQKYDFPHSLGFLYATFTDHLGFRSNNDEFKVMGLASYGEPVYYDELRDVAHLSENGSIRLDYSYFNRYFRGRTYVNDKFVEAFGPARGPGEELTQRHRDVAASIQKFTEESVMRLLGQLQRRTGVDSLCLSGGVALNSKLNGRILEEGPFKEVFMQPASHDGGCALGAALLVEHQVLGNDRRERMTSPYLGDSFSDSDIRRAMDQAKIRYIELQDVPRDTARLLAQGSLVAWFQGRSEWGPRALGARSILADPTRPHMKDTLNARVKHREEFRPFAPSVAVEAAGRYFDLETESPYMQIVRPVRADARDKLPAIVHVDGSARVHTVSKEANPLFHALLLEFEKLKGVPVLLNTSFNVNREPIVNTPVEAIRCFFSTGLDYLVMGRYLVGKEERISVPVV